MKRIFIFILLLSIPLPGQMKTGLSGIALIKQFESLRLESYLCPAGIWTIGYGTTMNVHPGMRISKAQAEQYLRGDLIRFERHVNQNIERILKAYEFDALISFTYNVGYRIKGDLRGAVNSGNSSIVVYHIQQFNRAKVNGALTILPGLVKRRKAETELYKNGRLFKGAL